MDSTAALAITTCRINTMFLLNYINDIELRRMIQAASCKSEEFNNFVDWVACG
jgi:TnpA family transposase